METKEFTTKLQELESERKEKSHELYLLEQEIRDLRQHFDTSLYLGKTVKITLHFGVKETLYLKVNNIEKENKSISYEEEHTLKRYNDFLLCGNGIRIDEDANNEIVKMIYSPNDKIWFSIIPGSIEIVPDKEYDSVHERLISFLEK